MPEGRRFSSLLLLFADERIGAVKKVPGKKSLLDKVQKRKPVEEKEILDLKKRGLVTGRKPNYFLSDLVLSKTGDGELKAQYIKHRGFDDEHYKNMILEYLKTYKEASRRDLETLLIAKLPDILDEKQKQNKISNLLAALRNEEKIRNKGPNKTPRYVLVEE